MNDHLEVTAGVDAETYSHTTDTIKSKDELILELTQKVVHLENCVDNLTNELERCKQREIEQIQVELPKR